MLGYNCFKLCEYKEIIKQQLKFSTKASLLQNAFFYTSIDMFTFPPSPFSTISNKVFNVILLPLFSILEIYSLFSSAIFANSFWVNFLSSRVFLKSNPILNDSKYRSSSSRLSVLLLHSTFILPNSFYIQLYFSNYVL